MEIKKYQQGIVTMNFGDNTTDAVAVESKVEQYEGAIVYVGEAIIRLEDTNSPTKETSVQFIVTGDSFNGFEVRACEYSFFVESWTLSDSFYIFFEYINNESPELLFKEQYDPNDRFHRLHEEEIKENKISIDSWYQANSLKTNSLNHQKIGSQLVLDILSLGEAKNSFRKVSQTKILEAHDNIHKIRSLSLSYPSTATLEEYIEKLWDLVRSCNSITTKEDLNKVKESYALLVEQLDKLLLYKRPSEDILNQLFSRLKNRIS